MEIERSKSNDDESLGFLEEYGSEPVGEVEPLQPAERGEPKQPPRKIQLPKDPKQIPAFAAAMLMLGASKVPGIAAKAAQGGGKLYRKCSESELPRRLILKAKEVESVVSKKCRESEMGKKLYKKVEDSELGKYAKKQAADNPKKAKQQLALATVVLFLLIRWLFFGNSTPPNVPIVSEEGILPNVLFVGAPQSGVMEVSEWLYSNTNVCPPKILEGDFESTNTAVGYWNRPNPMNLGLSWYAKRFKHCEDAEIIMDATPHYFHVSGPIYQTYHQIGKHAPRHLKIVMILREPTEREYWEYVKSPQPKLRTFESYLSDIVAPCYFGEQPTVPNQFCNIGASNYAKFVQQWFERFERKNILVLNFEELESSPKQALGRLEAFLGYTKMPRGASTLMMPESSKSSSVGKTIQASNLPGCAAQHVLQTIFEDWNEDLYTLLKKHKGPKVEQQPFQEFELGLCTE
mmetsp:Transcript_93493/g.140275  ORF Transcript_93493/g.140275 Transcript_93493/m.140275 type:complete len:461 (-) Transcript_93493:35-1417(-)